MNHYLCFSLATCPGCPASPRHGTTAIRKTALRFMAFALVLCAMSAQALTLTGVQSRKTHASGSGPYDLPVDIAQSFSGLVTVEPRVAGSGHLIVFQFDGPIGSTGNVSVIEDGLTLLAGTTAAASGNEVAVTLPAIADNKRVTVTLTNVNGVGLNASASLGFLLGDVNDSRSVSSSDVSAAKARSGQTASAANSRFDVNASGAITAADIAAIKARAGSSLTTPPVLTGATIGAGGGVINGPDGVQVVVPANAVSDPVTFRVDRAGIGAPELAGLNALSPVYAVTPHGQLFEASAVFSIPLAAAQIPAGATPILLKSELGGNWRVMRNISTDPARMAADIDGLSYFVIGTCSSVPTDEWTIGGVGCPANHELRLTLLDGNSSVQILRGPNGVQLPLWYVTDTPQTRDFIVDWFRPTSTRVDEVSVLGSRGGFSPNPRLVTGGTFAQRFTVTIDPAQIAGANGANGRLLRVTATATYTTTAFRIGTGNVPVGFEFETDIPILVRYNGVRPTISAQPANAGVIVGQAASFTVVASGTSLSYQWSRRDNAGAAFTDIGGATASSYTPPTTQLSDNGAQFQVRVCSTPTACITSNTATLSVLQTGAAPTFTLQPIDVSAAAGTTAGFNVIATGQPPPQVKWQVAASGSNTFADVTGTATCGVTSPPASGTTNVTATCTVGPIGTGNNGQRYRAVASNVIAPAGVASAFATLTVTATATAPSITLQPAPQSTTVGGVATFTVAATGTSALEFTWRLGANLPNLPSVSGGFAVAVPGGTCSGIVTYNTDKTTATLSNLSAACDGLAPIVTVSNGINPSATSNPALLTVNTAPTPTTGVCLAGTSGWCYAKPLPQANGLTGLVYGNGTFTAVGGAGTTLRTTDTGNTWQTSYEGGRANWTDVVSPASGLLVAAGWFTDSATQNSGIFTSADDGVTWTRRLDAGNPGTIAVSKLAFADALVGVAAGGRGIWRTVDGGLSWTAVSNAPSTLGVVSPFNGGVAWADTNTVLIYGGQGTILRSADAGLTWTVVSNAAITSDYYDMAFNSMGVGIAVGPSGQVARSTDGGATWQEVVTGMSDIGSAIAFANDNTVVVMGNLSQTMRSTDGGATWVVGFINGGSNYYRLRFATATTGLAVGANGGQIARTSDGGETWTIIGGGIYDQTVIGMATSPGGSVVLAGAFAQAGFLLRSITAGATWDNTGTRYTSPSFASEQVAIAIGSTQIVRSADAGQTWTVVYQPGTVSLTNTAMASANVGLVVGDNGLILRTTDGGLNWGVVPSGITQRIRAVRCLTTTLCLADGNSVAGDGLIRSTDAGASWSPVSLQGFAAVRSIARVSDSIAIIADDNGLQRSTDGGQSWTRVYTSQGSLLDVSFNGAGIGIAVGYEGILRSADQGLSWGRQSLPISFILYSATWINANTVLVGGESGAILRNLQAGAP